MKIAYLLRKLHTILDSLVHLKMLTKVLDGVIPDTYCRLDQKWLHDYRFDTVLDIGSNIGRFAVTASAVFPNAKVYAFEPLPECYEQTRRALAKIGKGEAFNVGLGDHNEMVSINRSSHLPSSSFLPMARTHTEAFKFAAHQEQVDVKVSRLDDIPQMLSLGESILVKIDVQGFERAVIAGGRNTIAKAKVVLIELSYEELYVGQPLFAEVFELLSGLGFKFAGTLAQMPHPDDGRMLDADCLFVRA